MPGPLPASGADWSVTTQAKGKKQLVEMDTDDDEDEHEEEATSEDEREAKKITFHAIPSLGLTFSASPQLHVTPLGHIRVLSKHLACYSHTIRLYSVM